MSDLEFRSVPFETFQVREAAEGGWTLEGLAVPYGQVIDHDGYRESFERGAFSDYDGSGFLFSTHDHQVGGLPIGTVTKADDRAEGLFITAKISATAKGSEVRQLIKDKVLKSLSVGFDPVEQRDDDGVTVRTKATLREVSVVPWPAYADAAITALRAHQDHSTASAVDQQKEVAMGDTITTADVAEVRSEIETLERRFAVLEERGAGSSTPQIRFNSLGEFVKGLATRSVTSQDAEMLTRAYTGAVTGDNLAQAPTWVQRDIKLIAQNRDVLELFAKAPLPATGMVVNYPIFGSTTGDVAIQATEGADLTYIELVTGNASAPVVTYGGYSSLSRQLIERNDIAYLNKVLDFQKLSYAKVTNGAVRTLLANNPTAYNQASVAFANSTKAGAWVDAALSGTDAISTNSVGLSAAVWLMPFSVFRRLAAIYDTTNRPVFALNGDGANTVGSVDIRGVKANVAGLPVVVDHGLTGTDSFIVSTDALTVMESGPWNLQDDNIINLTRDFSIYGYIAMTKNDVKGVTRVTHPAA